MIIDKFDVYRITVNNPSLINHAQSWIDQGFNVINVPGITPETMDVSEVNFYKKTVRDHAPIAEFTETEKAIFLSHRHLWKLCWQKDEAIVIIEEDVILKRTFNPVWNVDRLKYFCVGYNLKRPTPQKYRFTPAAGYIITPTLAKHLYTVTGEDKIRGNVDHYIKENRDDNSPSWAIDFAYQDPNRNRVGGIIDHE